MPTERGEPAVILSGCHAGPNPSPGLGTALSLRQAFPSCFLIAKDHSVHCSGIHADVFDEVWICPPWSQIDLKCHYMQIRDALERTRGLYISGLDVEVRWLASTDLRGV